VIDLTVTRAILDEVIERMEPLQGLELLDTIENDSQTKTVGKMNERAQKAQTSRDLQWIADSLNLAASLVRNELWVMKGEGDALSDS
jgi:hypothetical protein